MADHLFGDQPRCRVLGFADGERDGAESHRRFHTLVQFRQLLERVGLELFQVAVHRGWIAVWVNGASLPRAKGVV